MASNSNSAMDTLKGLLGDDADKKIQAVMESLSSTENKQEAPPPTSGGNNSSHSGGSNSGGGVDLSSALSSLGNDNSLQYIMQIKNIVDQLGSSGNDARSNLLMSLKPYMRSTRRQSIDSAVKMLNLTKLSGIFKMR